MYYYPTMVADTTEDLHIFIFGGGNYDYNLDSSLSIVVIGLQTR